MPLNSFLWNYGLRHNFNLFSSWTYRGVPWQPVALHHGNGQGRLAEARFHQWDVGELDESGHLQRDGPPFLQPTHLLPGVSRPRGPGGTARGMVFYNTLLLGVRSHGDTKSQLHQKDQSIHILSHHIDNKFTDMLKINLIGHLKYGNPDIQYLATLKIKIQIYNISRTLMKNLMSDWILCTFFNFNWKLS